MADGAEAPWRPGDPSVGGKGPGSGTSRQKGQEPRRLGMSLATSTSTVWRLRRSLSVKAKSEPGCRFYSLWDRVGREDILWKVCLQWGMNGGAEGVVPETLEEMDAPGDQVAVGESCARGGEGQDRSAATPAPGLDTEGQRGQPPLGIPAIRDRVAQAAV